MPILLYKINHVESSILALVNLVLQHILRFYHYPAK
jgi:hypothetical protein